MRGGVEEQNKILQRVRKECRVAAGMKNVKGFSRLTADPTKIRLGKRLNPDSYEVMSADNGFGKKKFPKL